MHNMYVELHIEGANKSASITVIVDRENYSYEIAWVWINGCCTEIKSMSKYTCWRWQALINSAYKQKDLKSIFRDYEQELVLNKSNY